MENGAFFNKKQTKKKINNKKKTVKEIKII